MTRKQSLWAWGSLIVILAGFVLVPVIQESREAERRNQSKSNLRQIGFALRRYHDVYKSFPAATKGDAKAKPEERLSWMAQLLPLLEQDAAYQQLDFDKAWDAPANAGALKNSVPTFTNPGLPADPKTKYGQTHYVGIAGVGKDAPMLPANHQRAGMFAYNRVTTLSDVTRGTANTMAVSEASKDLGPWGAGGQSTIRALTEKPYINGPDGLGGVYRGGMHVLMLDVSVRFLSENTDPSVLEKLSTITDKKFERERAAMYEK